MIANDFLLNLLGKELSSPDVYSFLLSVGRFNCCELDSTAIYDSVSGGVKVFFAKDVFTYTEKMHFYKLSNYGSYTGDLPYGVTFADSADDVKSKIGVPTKAFRPKVQVSNQPQPSKPISHNHLDGMCHHYDFPFGGSEVFDRLNDSGQTCRIIVLYSVGKAEEQLTNEGTETYRYYSFGAITQLTIELLTENKDYIN